MRILLAYCILTIIVMLNSCKKADEDNLNKRQENITSGKWYYKSMIEYQTSPTDSSYNLLFQMGECERDDYHQFNSDGTFIIHENMDKCNINQDIKDSGTWKLEDNNTALTRTFSNNGSPYTATVSIEKLTNEILVLSYRYKHINGSSIYEGKVVNEFIKK